jgi:hypothetical protein
MKGGPSDNTVLCPQQVKYDKLHPIIFFKDHITTGSDFVALHWQWQRLHGSEIFSDGTIDGLIDYLRIYVPLKNFSLIYGDVAIAGEGLQNSGLCSALRAFEQGGIFTVPHLL